MLVAVSEKRILKSPEDTTNEPGLHKPKEVQNNVEGATEDYSSNIFELMTVPPIFFSAIFLWSVITCAEGFFLWIDRTCFPAVIYMY